MICMIIILAIAVIILILIQKSIRDYLSWVEHNLIISNEMFIISICHLNELYGEETTKTILHNTLKELVNTYQLYPYEEIESRVDEFYNRAINHKGD